MRISIQKIHLIAAALSWMGVLAVVPSALAQNPGNTRSINGVQLYYEVVGDGAPLLLLHYFGGAPKAGSPKWSDSPSIIV